MCSRQSQWLKYGSNSLCKKVQPAVPRVLRSLAWQWSLDVGLAGVGGRLQWRLMALAAELSEDHMHRKFEAVAHAVDGTGAYRDWSHWSPTP